MTTGTEANSSISETGRTIYFSEGDEQDQIEFKANGSKVSV